MMKSRRRSASGVAGGKLWWNAPCLHVRTRDLFGRRTCDHTHAINCQPQYSEDRVHGQSAENYRELTYTMLVRLLDKMV